jgi:hypothetical protein
MNERASAGTKCIREGLLAKRKRTINEKDSNL